MWAWKRSYIFRHSSICPGLVVTREQCPRFASPRGTAVWFQKKGMMVSMWSPWTAVHLGVRSDVCEAIPTVQ